MFSFFLDKNQDTYSSLINIILAFTVLQCSSDFISTRFYQLLINEEIKPNLLLFLSCVIVIVDLQITFQGILEFEIRTDLWNKKL